MRTLAHFLFITLVLAAGQAMAVPVDFTVGQGYVDGPLPSNTLWNGEIDNVVETAGAGHDGALGLVHLQTSTNAWVECIYSNALTANVEGDTMTVSAKFRYETTGPVATGPGSIFSLSVYDDSTISTNKVRVGLRRRVEGVGPVLRFFRNETPGVGSLGATSVHETNVNVTTGASTSDWLEVTVSLTKGASSNDWTMRATLTNLATTNDLISDAWVTAPLPAFQDDPEFFAGFDSSLLDADNGTTNRVIDTFEVGSLFIPPPVTILGVGVGDGDFEYPEVPGDPGAVTGPLWYTNSPNWFNASGSDGINFTRDDQTGASSQPGSRAGMPYHQRVQVNNSGYTIATAGEEFSLRYDFGAGGSQANWFGSITNQTFLFTADVPVDGSLDVTNMTRLVEDNYLVDRINDPQWTTRVVDDFYTSTEADVGKTVYFGMEFGREMVDLFPRIDVIQLTVQPVAPCPSPAFLSVVLNGANVAVSWDSTDGCDYQLQTNDTLDVNWGDYGSVIVGDGSTQTGSVAVSGDTLNIRAEVQ